MTEYIEETIRDKEQLQQLKEEILKRTEGKDIKQIGIKNISFRQNVLCVQGEKYELIVSIIFFSDVIGNEIFNIFLEIERIILGERYTE